MPTGFEIKRIDLWTLFRVSFFIYAALGLVAGLFYGLVLLAVGAMGGALWEQGDFPHLGLLGGVLGVVLVPGIALVYGAIGSLVVTVIGALFNLVCRLGGGIRFDVALVPPALGARPSPVAPQRPPGPPEPPPASTPPSGGDVAGE